MIGNFIQIPIVSTTCLTNIISYVFSDNAIYSASVDERVTLLLAFDFHGIEAPQKYKFQPKTLMRVS
jgi:hypothetical protein